MGLNGETKMWAAMMQLVLAAVLCGEAMGQSGGCTTVLTNLAPCLNYITGNSSTPSSSCCSQLASVVQSSPSCLCSVLNGGGVSSFRININQTLALSLPGACNVRTPPLSQCNNGPTSGATAPTVSPAISPSDSYNQTPDAAITPSASDIPSGAGSGSKTVPTTADGSSDGIITRVPFSLMLFMYLLLSSSSTIIIKL